MPNKMEPDSDLSPWEQHLRHFARVAENLNRDLREHGPAENRADVPPSSGRHAAPHVARSQFALGNAPLKRIFAHRWK